MAKYRVRLHYLDPEALGDRTHLSSVSHKLGGSTETMTFPIDSIVDETFPLLLNGDIAVPSDSSGPLVAAIMLADWLFEQERDQDGWANGAELGTKDAGGEHLPFWVDVVNTLSKIVVYHRGPVKL